MIPLRLYMRNFMCYREQTLDLRGIDLACVTGDNGHGKSAILDAMTWGLWGYSRLGARRDDELIHLGEIEMEVEFEFELHQGIATPARGDASRSRIRYRVLRKRSKRKRGQSSLELQGWDSEAGKYRPLSEPTIAATQEQINNLLRMVARRAFGFHSAKALIKMLFLVAGGIETNPPLPGVEWCSLEA